MYPSPKAESSFSSPQEVSPLSHRVHPAGGWYLREFWSNDEGIVLGQWKWTIESWKMLEASAKTLPQMVQTKITYQLETKARVMNGTGFPL